MRIKSAAVFCSIFLLASAGHLTEASAEGFFQKLFGWGSSSTPSPAPPAPAYRAPALPPSQPSEHQSRRDPALDSQGSTRYRTVCVRTCDGYYFPISFATSRQGFYKDANSCRAACGQEAQLFYHSNKSGDASEMVDLSGRPYVSLPNAFKYRKKLVEGCKCKPEPWAQSELDRHKRYELAEEATKQKTQLAEQQAQKPDATADSESKTDTVAAVEPTPAETPPADADDTPTVSRAAFVSAPVNIDRSDDPSKAVRDASRKNQERTNDQPWVTTSRPVARAAAARPVKVQNEGFFGLGAGSNAGYNQKYRWPGD